jgi:hypothetical protein
MASEPRALGQPGAGARRDLVANPPEHLKPVFLTARGARRILEAPVQALRGKMGQGSFALSHSVMT